MAPPDGMRLPTHWIPESYDVRLIPYLEPGRFTFDGFVRMNLVSAANSAQIVFHAKDMTIYEEILKVYKPVLAWSIRQGTRSFTDRYH